MFCSDTAAEKLDPTRGTEGPLAWVARGAQQVLGEPAERRQTLSDAIEAGSCVIAVQVPDDEDEEAAEPARGRAPIERGATEVAYDGEFAVEELALAT